MIEPHSIRATCTSLPATLGSECMIISKTEDSKLGTIEETAARALYDLISRGCELQIDCHINLIRRPAKRRGLGKPAPQYSTSLSIVIYGPLGEFDYVGDVLDTHELYLQDPTGCSRNVRYRNPHRISGKDPDAPMTIEQQMELSTSRCEILEQSTSYLSDLESHMDLPLTGGPGILNTQLYPHQQQALTFMKRRERGWALTGDQPDVWKALGGDRFLNTVADHVQAGAPPDFRGGILADAMGLGKSLSMISLIASDDTLAQCSGPQATQHSQCTLLVVPSSLIQTWDGQLIRHIPPGQLRWGKHHEKQKIRHRDDVNHLNIVITTYQTIASEWRRRHAYRSPIFSIYWHRIVLDEAHCIRDRTSLTAEAICALNADRRWAMTGTPIQNRLSDLSSLLQFLRVYPYSNPDRFNEDIIHLWKDHAEEEAIDRAKKLFHLIGIRRSNSTIDLPKRTDELHRLEFSPSERTMYESPRTETLETIERAIFSDSPPRGSFLNALHRFHSLRMMCNLGTCSPITEVSASTTDGQHWNSASASKAFAMLLAAGQVVCKRCATNLDGLTPDDLKAGSTKAPYVCQGGSIICHPCVQKHEVEHAPEILWCDHSLPCAYAAVEESESPNTLAPSHLMSGQSSTKVQELIKDIKRHPTEKCVVFSLWTSTLDLAQKALEAEGLKFARVDGSVHEKNRKKILNSFRQDPCIAVILFTISCGAVGLDLTAASRAYIMEPQWNPTVEEQALARIHRLGQVREVTTVRFVVKDSCEEHVRRVQNRKTLMADVVLSQKRSSGSNKAAGKLDSLRSLLS